MSIFRRTAYIGQPRFRTAKVIWNVQHYLCVELFEQKTLNLFAKIYYADPVVQMIGPISNYCASLHHMYGSHQVFPIQDCKKHCLRRARATTVGSRRCTTSVN